MTPTGYLLFGIDSRHPDYLVLLYWTSLSRGYEAILTPGSGLICLMDICLNG